MKGQIILEKCSISYAFLKNLFKAEDNAGIMCDMQMMTHDVLQSELAKSPSSMAQVQTAVSLLVPVVEALAPSQADTDVKSHWPGKLPSGR